MEGEKCKDCGESAVVADEGQVVCTNCGQIQEDATVFVTEGVSLPFHLYLIISASEYVS